jgi:hypothetical protein
MAGDEFVIGARAVDAVVSGAKFDPLAILGAGHEAATAGNLTPEIRSLIQSVPPSQLYKWGQDPSGKVFSDIVSDEATHATATDPAVLELPVSERAATLRGIISPDLEGNISDPSGLRTELFKAYGRPPAIDGASRTGIISLGGDAPKDAIEQVLAKLDREKLGRSESDLSPISWGKPEGELLSPGERPFDEPVAGAMASHPRGYEWLTTGDTGARDIGPGVQPDFPGTTNPFANRVIPDISTEGFQPTAPRVPTAEDFRSLTSQFIKDGKIDEAKLSMFRSHNPSFYPAFARALKDLSETARRGPSEAEPSLDQQILEKNSPGATVHMETVPNTDTPLGRSSYGRSMSGGMPEEPWAIGPQQVSGGEQMRPDQLLHQIKDGKVDPSRLPDHQIDSLFEEPTFGD